MNGLAQDLVSPSKEFPVSLLDWAGHRSGGVRKPFFAASGRPCKIVIETPLLARLRSWVNSVVAEPSAPRAILLIGGPGNGKTEAVEETLRTLDASLGLDGNLISQFESLFSGRGEIAIPRIAKVVLEEISKEKRINEVCVVQDASVTDTAQPQRSPAELLVRDIGLFIRKESKSIYLACVNRGILDEALTFATDKQLRTEQILLETVIRSVGLTPSAPACWPLEGFDHIAVWPMDVETIIWTASDRSKDKSPAAQLLEKATESAKWPKMGDCAAGDHCPFCRSRAMLEKESHRDALLQILRWYEIASGKRWSFRDLFSLFSYSLAGTAQEETTPFIGPCEWAAKLYELSLRPSTSRTNSLKFSAPFILVSNLYQHSLFCSWPRLHIRGLLAEIRDLEIQNDPGIMGFHYFLSTPRESSVPATLKPQLIGIGEALDPALVEPSAKIELSTREIYFGKDIDARFSQSIAEGLAQVRRQLSLIEIELLERLEKTDELLSSSTVRRRRPATAILMQKLIRDFACRLVRRSLGVRHGIVRHRDVLTDFEKVISGNTHLLHKAVKQVEALINEKDYFTVVLNSTFGEPLVPSSRRATVRTAKQKVRSVENPTRGRPAPPVRFLSIGGRGHPLALTYDLFRSVRELEAGMLPASLPRPVVALLDTTKARLAGTVVRDEEMLDGAEIRIGTRDSIISRELGEFVVMKTSLI